MWDTTDGGPCFLRPIQHNAFDAPMPEQAADPGCLEFFPRASGPCEIRKSYLTTDGQTIRVVFSTHILLTVFLQSQYTANVLSVNFTYLKCEINP